MTCALFRIMRQSRIKAARNLPLFPEKLDYRLGRGFGGGWILAGHQIAVDFDVRLPGIALAEESAFIAQHVLDHERHDLRQLDPVFLPIGEPRDSFALDQGKAIRTFGMKQDRRTVTDTADGFFSGEKRLDYGNGIVIFRQIPERPVPAGIKYRIELFRIDRFQTKGVGEQLLGIGIFLKSSRRLCLCLRFLAFRVDRRLAASR